MAENCLHCALSEAFIEHFRRQQNLPADGNPVVQMPEARHAFGQMVAELLNNITDPDRRMFEFGAIVRSIHHHMHAGHLLQQPARPEGAKLQ